MEHTSTDQTITVQIIDHLLATLESELEPTQRSEPGREEPPEEVSRPGSDSEPLDLISETEPDFFEVEPDPLPAFPEPVVVPVPTPPTVVADAHSRFYGAPWYGGQQKCTVGGAGSIGSWLVLFLMRAGYNVRVVDMDVVTKVNLSGQIYGKRDIGLEKVFALARYVSSVCDFEETGQWLVPYKARIEDVPNSAIEQFCFSAFDSVDARRAMFEKWKAKMSKGTSKGIFIDGRLSAESYHVYAVRPSKNEIEAYEKTLWSKEEVQEEVCSYKSTTHMSAAIASDMVKVFNNHVTNLKLKLGLRKVPLYMFSEAVCMTREG